MLLDRTWIEHLADRLGDTPVSVFVDLLDYYELRQRGMTTLAGAAVHDALAVAYVTHPGLLAGVRRPVEIVCSPGPTRGMTLVDLRPRRQPDPAVAKVIEWADVRALRELMLETLVELSSR